MEKRFLAIFFMSIIFVSGISFASAAYFEVDSLLLRISLRQGDSIEKAVRLSTDFGGSFSAEVLGLPGVSVENEFILQAGETKDLVINFSSKDLEPGIYAGYLSITSGSEVREIPVIFEVESEDVFFDINLDVPPQYSQVPPGGRLVAEFRIFDLTGLREETALGPSNIELEYVVKSLEGVVVNSESEEVVVDGQARLTKTIIFSDDIRAGDYLLISSAKFKSSIGTSSYFFKIVDDGTSIGGFSFEGFDWRFMAVLIVIVIFFLGIIFLFVYLIHERDKLFLELKKYNAEEMQKQRELLLAQTSVGKRRPVRNTRREAEKKIENLRQRQRKRVETFKRLKKEGKTDEMMKALRKWKQEGYNTVLLESRIKGNTHLRSQVARLKKEGYGRKTRKPVRKTKAYKKKKR